MCNSREWYCAHWFIVMAIVNVSFSYYEELKGLLWNVVYLKAEVRAQIMPEEHR